MKVKLTETQYKALAKFIDEARAAESPTSLKNLFNDNPNAKYFTVVQRLKGGNDSEYPFEIFTQNGHKGVKDIGIAGKTKGCETDLRPDTMLYGTSFSLSFGSCGVRNINNVIGIKIYDDETSLKSEEPLDSIELEHELDNTPQELADKYYDILKNIEVGREIYIDSKNKWDGVVISKRPESIGIELYKHGIPINEADDDSDMEWNVQPDEPKKTKEKPKLKKKSIILTLDLSSNPFYVENNKLMLKGVSFDSLTNEKSEFVVPVDKFITNNAKAKPEANQDSESETPKDVKSDDELRQEAKAAYEMILNDPLLKKAFYRKPSFWNLFVSELKGKKSIGKGILPTLQLLNRYGTDKLNTELGADFIQGKSVSFQTYGKPYTINVDEKVFQLDAGKIYRAVVRNYKTGDNFYVLDSKEGNGNGYKLYIKSKTDVPDVYKCELIRYVRKTNNEIKEFNHQGDVYIKLEKNSDGYEPSSQTEKNTK